MRSDRSAVAVAALGIASFGIVLTTLGASLPVVMSRFGIDMARAGSLLSLLSFGALAGSLVFGPIVDRRGYKTLLIFAFVTIIIGLEALAFAPSMKVLTGAVLLIAFSGGLLNGAANALVADVAAERRAATLTLVGACFGLGAAGVPLALATLSGRWSHTAILASIAPVIVIPLLLTAVTTFPPSKRPDGAAVADARRLLRDPALLLMGLILFLESGMENTVGGWITTFAVKALNVGADHASLYLSAFWFGLMVARLILGTALRHVPTMRILFVSIAISMISVLVLVSSEGVTTAAVAAFLLGAGFAATYPAIYGFVGDRYAHVSGTALGLVISMALFGGMSLPYAAGVVGEAHGMRTSLLIVPVCLLAQVFLLPILSRATGRPPHLTEDQHAS